MPRVTDHGRRGADALAAIGLTLLPFAIFGHALLPGRVMSPADVLLTVYPWKAIAPEQIPANLLLWEVTYLVHPSLIYAAREIHEGRFPLWNPYASTGFPFFASPHTALLFPLNALAYLLPAPTALTLISILKLSTAGLGMYWFLRLLSVAPIAAVVGSVAFMLNGALVAWLQWPFGSVMACLPWLFGATERLRQRGDLRGVAALAIAVAVSVFAGYPQAAFHAFLATGAYAACRAIGTARWASFLVRFTTGAGLGVALASVQLFPFLEYLWASSAFAYRAEWMPVVSLTPRHMITFLMPYYYGSPTGRDFWGLLNLNHITASVGLVPWVVLPAALVAWSRAETKFFFGLAALTGAMVYGVPLVTPAVASLPLLSLTITARIVSLFAFSLCALGAIGLDAIGTAQRGPMNAIGARVKFIFVSMVVIAFFFVVANYPTLVRPAAKVSIFVQYLSFLFLLTLATLVVLRLLRERGTPLRWWLALVLVQVASVFPLPITSNPIVDARLFYPAPPALRFLQAESARDQGRVFLEGALNTGMLYGLFEAAGFDGMTLRRVEEVVSPAASSGLVGGGPLFVTTGFSSPVFDLLGIRHILVPPGAAKPAPHFSLEYDGPDARIYRNPRAFPRAFLASRVRQCVDDTTALRLMREQLVDVREEVLLAACDEAPAAGPRGSVSNAEMREYSPHRILIRAMSDSPAYLVLTDAWFPGWRAWVNGREQPVRRANHAFRAVWIPPGHHDVEFRYRPLSFQLGLALSLMAASITGGLWVGTARSRHD